MFEIPHRESNYFPRFAGGRFICESNYFHRHTTATGISTGAPLPPIIMAGGIIYGGRRLRQRKCFILAQQPLRKTVRERERQKEKRKCSSVCQCGDNVVLFALTSDLFQSVATWTAAAEFWPRGIRFRSVSCSAAVAGAASTCRAVLVAGRHYRRHAHGVGDQTATTDPQSVHCHTLRYQSYYLCKRKIRDAADSYPRSSCVPLSNS